MRSTTQPYSRINILENAFVWPYNFEYQNLMDILLARTFLAAAEGGSFVAAAQRVHASPSAVTERIKQLEHALGVRLFDRDKRGCRLTQAGERFVEAAQAMIRAWDTGRSRVGLPSRYRYSLRIGGQHALWPSLLIPGWAKSPPSSPTSRFVLRQSRPRS